MWCGIVTLFPEMFNAITDYGMTRRAIEKKLLSLECWNPRDFTEDKYHTVDDKPYGGGPGMVMQVSPLREAVVAARKAAPMLAKTVYLSPQGRRLEQQDICDIAASRQPLILVAGRYEGVDERFLTLEIEEEWSIGDYVLSGGELAAMVVIDAVTRWLPQVLGHPGSVALDSFSEGLLDYPHYTRPEVVDGLAVPEILLSGDHQMIAEWRLKQRLGRTWLRRPDLLEKLNLDEHAKRLLAEFRAEVRGKV